ncbi:MAG: RMD1 family protein [Hyphomicrobiaceae bacterium]|nr:RMD1 family protein [Hyphomicrobiaceae bacterium]
MAAFPTAEPLSPTAAGPAPPVSATAPAATITLRAIQIGERLDLKGLEREDAFSTDPLGFKTASGGSVMLFKSGAAVFAALTPIEEEGIVAGLTERIYGPLTDRETEAAQIILRPEAEEIVTSTGVIQLKAADPNRLLLAGEALAVSVALAYDERRIAQAFDQIGRVAEELKDGKLPSATQPELLRQIGEALSIQQRLAARVDLDEKPDVLWDHPELERIWAKLVDEYDLPQRARAIDRKLAIIRDTSETIGDLISTRTSHKLEWYIIALIAFEIGMSLYDRFLK